MWFHTLIAFSAILVNTTVFCVRAIGEDFRIETDVYEGEGARKVGENLTLFHQGTIYDYQWATSENGTPEAVDVETVTIFQPSSGKFTILSVAQHSRTEISTDELQRFMVRLRHWAKNHQDPFLQFAAEPEFRIFYEQEARELTMSHDMLRYAVTTTGAPSTSVETQYQAYSNWFARLNAMVHPGGLPPFPRLALNEQMSKRHLLAEEVRLSIREANPKGGKLINLRSQHKIRLGLQASDRERIEKTIQQLKSFSPLQFAKYRATLR